LKLIRPIIVLGSQLPWSLSSYVKDRAKNLPLTPPKSSNFSLETVLSPSTTTPPQTHITES